MVRPDGSLAMVDIQDARWGPDSYDLASLLRDAYVDLDESWIEPFVDSYRSSLPEPPELRAFRRRFDTVSAQRMIKALGTFGYQMSALGRQRYASAIPRTQARLRRLLPGLDETRRLGKLLVEAELL
jgi:aminoglycoside/choline kinase family phosphotransferase